MLLYETEIKKKVGKLPDDIQKEILDYIDFLSNKYSFSTKENKKHKKSSNPFKELAGFASIGPLDSKDIDKEVYGL